MKPSNLDVEQDGLRRLVTGYEAATVHGVRAIFPEEIRPLNREWKAYCDNSTDADEADDLTERLISKDQSTFNALKSDKVGKWVDYVLQSIDDIKFAGEFAEVNNSFKKSYVDTACATIMELDLDDAADDVAKEKIKKDFKNRHRATVTARNQLHELYYNFGPAVFLDPSLMKTGNNGKPSYTKTYSATVDHLIENIPHVDKTNPEPYVSCLHRLQENNKKMLISMLNVLGGSEVARFVDGFIQSNPPTIG